MEGLVMPWHLKDRELEKKLNELTKGEFSRNLHQYDDEHFSSFSGEILSFTEDYCEYDGSAGKGANRQSQFLFFFNNDAIEEVPEYKAGGWNHWPETEPEECVLMEIKLDGDEDHRSFNFFLNGIWYHSMGCTCIGLSSEEFSYRPAKLFFEEQRINKKD